METDWQKEGVRLAVGFWFSPEDNNNEIRKILNKTHNQGVGLLSNLQ